MKLPYKQGTWFAMPLNDYGYCVGVVARMSPRGNILLVYLFCQRYSNVPSICEVENLKAEQACKCIQIGYLGFKKGNWPIIGDSTQWNSELWPMPLFVRKDEISQSAFLVHYSPDDPSKVCREERVPYGIDGLESDSLYGAEAGEILMTRLLSK